MLPWWGVRAAPVYGLKDMELEGGLMLCLFRKTTIDCSTLGKSGHFCNFVQTKKSSPCFHSFISSLCFVPGSRIQNCLLKYFCVFVCVCVYMYGPKNNLRCCSSGAITFIFWDKVSHWPQITRFSKVGCHWAPGTACLPSAGVRSICHYTWLFTWVLGLELRHLCIQGKHSTDWAVILAYFQEYLGPCNEFLPRKRTITVANDGK